MRESAYGIWQVIANSSATRLIWLVRVPSRPISHSNRYHMHILPNLVPPSFMLCVYAHTIYLANSILHFRAVVRWHLTSLPVNRQSVLSARRFQDVSHPSGTTQWAVIMDTHINTVRYAALDVTVTMIMEWQIYFKVTSNWQVLALYM